MYFMGLDLGQSQDFSAAIVLDRQQEGSKAASYVCVLCHRWDLGTPYPRVIGSLQHHLARPAVELRRRRPGRDRHARRDQGPTNNDPAADDRQASTDASSKLMGDGVLME